MYHSQRRLIARFAFALLIAAVFGSRAVCGEVIEEKDITYGKAGDRALQLDLARPEGDGPFPALVFVHGGGWRGGARTTYSGAIVEAAKRGFVAVTVTYRLTEPDKDGKVTNPFPAQVNDVKCAVRWLRANAEKYNVDPQRIGATGGSAGGHLSLMLGLTDGSSKLEGDGGYPDRSSKVQAVVNYFGPTDMVELHRTSEGAAPIVASFLGGGPQDIPDLYRAASPVTYISADDGPVLTIHGTADRLVPPEQAKLLDEKMKAEGVSHTLLLLEGQGHGFQGEAGAQAIQATFDFFEKHLKPATP